MSRARDLRHGHARRTKQSCRYCAENAPILEPLQQRQNVQQRAHPASLKQSHCGELLAGRPVSWPVAPAGRARRLGGRIGRGLPGAGCSFWRSRARWRAACRARARTGQGNQDVRDVRPRTELEVPDGLRQPPRCSWPLSGKGGLPSRSQPALAHCAIHSASPWVAPCLAGVHSECRHGPPALIVRAGRLPARCRSALTSAYRLVPANGSMTPTPGQGRDVRLWRGTLCGQRVCVTRTASRGRPVLAGVQPHLRRLACNPRQTRCC
jgi:hypothetical protein